MAKNKQPTAKPKPPKPPQPKKKVGAPKGSKNRAKKPDEVAFIHKALIAHLRKGKGWDDFRHADKKTLKSWRDQKREDFPWEPIEEARRQGMAVITDMLWRGAMGKIKGFNARTALYIARNKGLFLDERRADLDFDPADDAKGIPVIAGIEGPVQVRVTYRKVTKGEDTPPVVQDAP